MNLFTGWNSLNIWEQLIITNQNSIYKETKSKVISRNACYHSVQNCFPACYPKI